MPRMRLPVAFGVLALGCSQTVTATPCTSGQQIACVCPGGRTGSQTCQLSGSYSACACVDAGSPDVVTVIDAPTANDAPPTFDAFVDAGSGDGGPSTPDATIDAGADGGGVDARSGCAMQPFASVASMPVSMAIAGATDFAFDGLGNIAVAFGTEIDQIAPGGVRTMMVNMLPGTVSAIRYAPTGDLLLALNTGMTDGGVPTGEVAAFRAGASGSFRIIANNVGAPGGLAVDSAGYVWFSDGISGVVSRALLGTTTVGMPVAVFSDVPGPTHLAFDGTGSYLYVTSSVAGMTASIYQVPLMYGDGGASVSTSPATQYVGGITRVNDPLTGLAVDECGNVYGVDQGRNQIWRIPPPPLSTFVQIVTDITGPTGLAFGQGGAFDGRTLYSLDSTGVLHGANVSVEGVPLPLPP